MGRMYTNSWKLTTSKEGLERVWAGKGGNIIVCNANLFYFKNKIWGNKAK